MLIVVSPLACVIAALILLPSPLMVTLEPNRLFFAPPVLASKLRPLSIVFAKLPKVFATPYNWLPLIASVDCAFTRPAATFVMVRFTVSLPTLTVESALPPA